MGGKSKSTTVGYHYRPAFHVGLVGRQIDAFLEYRAADKTAWAGALTASGRFQIDAPDLFGGEKDQGGIVGPVDVMFGEPDQLPNPYLQEVFGSQTVAWRGMTTLVFAGGRFGAMNPFQQKSAYKIRKILQGWDGEAWYPERAAIPVQGSGVSGYFFVAAGAEVSSPAGVYGTVPNDMIATAHEIGAMCIAVRNAAEGLDLTIEQAYIYPRDGAWDIGATSTLYGPNRGICAVRVTPVCPAGYDVSFVEHGPGTPLGISEPSVYCSTEAGGVNPAHLLYYVRTDPEKGAEPRSAINEASLISAADRLFAEGFGLCQVVYDPQHDTPDAFSERICRIIGGSFERSLIDGQWHLDLARGDYDLESIPVIGDDDILDFRVLPTTLHGVTNSLSVRYFDPERKETVITPAVRALGLIRVFGEIHETLDFPEIPIASLALRVADRELRARVTPSQAFELTTRPTLLMRRNQYFRLQIPRRGIVDMVCIVGERDGGTLRSGATRWKVAQDVYSLPATTYVEIEHGVDVRPPQAAEPIEFARPFEAPYINVVGNLPRAELDALPEDVGYLIGVAARPAHGLDYSMAVRTDGGVFEVVANGEWCPTGTTSDPVEIGSAPVVVPLSTARGLDRVPVGSAVLMNDELLRLDAKQMDPPQVVLARGCGDTVPQLHFAGSRMWFLVDDVAVDASEYSEGESVDVKMLTNSGSQQLPLGAAPSYSVTFASRQARPYPPGRIRINELAAPVLLSGELSMTWAHRDRLLQADQLFDQEASNIGPEAGVTVSVRTFLDSVLVDEQTGLVGTGTVVDPGGDGLVRIEIDSTRGELASRYMHVREFDYSAAPAETDIYVDHIGDIYVDHVGINYEG
ncbi:hypothetical protein WCE55_02150 [Luteimonas sp. MJ293]|uniref:hypothetical protein n=1 Tax=Luteimonas sp. MJ146 TaxID=3129240 RepID=UPI0031B9B92F